MNRPTDRKSPHALMPATALAAIACLALAGCVATERDDQADVPGDDKTPGAADPSPRSSVAISFATSFAASAPGAAPGLTDFMAFSARVDALPLPGDEATFAPRATVDLWFQTTDWNTSTSRRVQIAANELAEVIDYSTAGYALQLADGTRVRVEPEAAYVEQYGADDLAALIATDNRLGYHAMSGAHYSNEVQGDAVYADLPGDIYYALVVPAVDTGYGLNKRIGTDAFFVECDLAHDAAAPSCIFVATSDLITEVAPTTVSREATIAGPVAAFMQDVLLGDASNGHLITSQLVDLTLACDGERCAARWAQARHELLGLDN